MPGTTRYSATFDRPYEEEDTPALPPVTRRSRSQSWQAESITSMRGAQGPLFSGSSSRSSSTEKAKGAEVIPTRTSGKTTVKAHNNPFQFVKVGTCPLYKSAEELLKKTKEIKKAPVIKEEEEEWQSNLDSWKSRRRKMSEGAFRRQEELRKLELEQQNANSQQQQKKIKTFSEIVEERAHRGRALSLCLFSSPLDSSEWIFENTNREKKSRSQDLLSEGSAESSNINSDEENDSYSKQNSDVNNRSSESRADSELNGVRNSTSNSSISKNSDLSELDVSQESISQKDQTSFGGFIDSGLESLSSSHRTGDIPDSGSDFSQDSGSSIDCDSPRVSGLITTGIELLEEFSSKEECTNGSTDCLKEKPSAATPEKPKTASLPSIHSKIANGSPKLANKELKPKAVKSPKSQTKLTNESKPTAVKTNNAPRASEKSVESENEMFVDDFEELARLKASEPNKTPKPSSQMNGLTTTLNDHSLNVIYQSQPIQNGHSSSSSNVNAQNNSRQSGSSYSLISEKPVEKITEEMEKLILQQLEEEERAKEISSDVKLNGEKGDLDFPAKKVEPPKEKPPPPPTSNSSPTKDCSVKRVNSTKRILKEINKRRSDFLGIDQTKQDGNISEEPCVPPPPALEDILRAEREQDRLRRHMLEATAASQASVEEDEITRKEREIIENLETEERLKSAQGKSTSVPDFTNAHVEKECLKQLQEERKRMEEEILLAEEQRVRLEEAALLQKREQQVKEQEDVKPGECSASLSSLDAPAINAEKPEALLAVSNANLAKNGDGINNEPSLSSNEVEVCKAKEQPPPVAPKPPKKKKEALRKERERLRQEQEALQREREEHRRKMQLEQEQLKKSLPSSHVLDAPVSQVAPPPPAKLILPTHVLIHPSPSSSSSALKREVPGSGLPNCNKPAVVGSSSGLQPQTKPSSKSRISPPRSKAAVNDMRGQPKLPLSRKPDTSVETRYNQNHWLVQEAEMRRIMEQNERQRAQSNPVQFTQYPDEYSDKRRPVQNSNVKVSGYGQQFHPSASTKLCAPSQHMDSSHYLATYSKQFEPNLPLPPTKPSRVAPLERQEQMLSVSGRKRCSHCAMELGRGAAMIIESLQLYYHIHCFRCCVCEAQLGNGSCGTDVRVRNNKLHCHNCYSNDEAGLKFSQV